MTKPILLVLENNLSIIQQIEYRLSLELGAIYNIISLSHVQDMIEVLKSHNITDKQCDIKIAIIDYDLLDITGIEFIAQHLGSNLIHKIIISTWEKTEDINDALQNKMIDEFVSKLEGDYMDNIIDVAKNLIKPQASL